jgi:hypothetical protein
MSSQFSVKIDKEDVERRLGDLKSKAPRVIAKGLNDTAKQARRRLADKARETYTVKIGGFTNHVKFKQRASAGSLEAILGVDGRTLTLNRFAMRQNYTYAKVLQAGSFKELRNQAGALSFNRNGLILQRKTKNRYPLKGLHGPSVPSMIGSKRVYGILEPHINSDLKKNIDAAIAKIVG